MVYGAHQPARWFAVQQMQEVTADRIVIRLHVDALAVMCVVKSSANKGRAERGHQPVDGIACRSCTF